MPTPDITEGPYLTDLLAQPAAIEATLATMAAGPDLRGVADDLAAGRLRRIVLTGMGSSLHALHGLQIDLVAADRTAVMVECAELIHHQRGWLTPGTLVVAASQSGASAEIVKLIETNAGRARLLGVTNTPGSPLDVAADISVHTAAGPEATVSCKSYVATLAALEYVGCGLGAAGDWPRRAGEITAVAQAMAGYLARWREQVGELATVLDRSRATFYLGRGRSLSSALTAGLITKEATGCAAEGMTSPAFRHGPFELLGPGVQAVVFAGGNCVRTLNRRMCDEIGAAGARAFWCGADAEGGAFRLPSAPEALLPMVEILPVQMMTLALAAMGGREAGRFARATKVTRDE
ncbi:MAG TPA: SIS domain-containing protein [Candidatus Didemnitutus sp.]|jgi:glucosamine--fructose-6-phosphate aminotransferase (isomerizing)